MKSTRHRRILRWILSTLPVLAVIALFVPGSAMAQTVEGTPHDLQTRLGITDICVVCHTPHSAQSTQTIPLWNHVTTETTGFTVYAGTLDNGTVGQPTGVSLACLSCHDGSVAIDSYGGVTTGTDTIGGTWNLTRDLSDDHPISFSITDDADPGIRTIALITAPAGSNLPLFGSNEVQCPTCHNPHDNIYGKFLRNDNAGSGLCLDCHIK